MSKVPQLVSTTAVTFSPFLHGLAWRLLAGWTVLRRRRFDFLAAASALARGVLESLTAAAAARDQDRRDDHDRQHGESAQDEPASVDLPAHRSEKPRGSVAGCGNYDHRAHADPAADPARRRGAPRRRTRAGPRSRLRRRRARRSSSPASSRAARVRGVDPGRAGARGERRGSGSTPRAGSPSSVGGPRRSPSRTTTSTWSRCSTRARRRARARRVLRPEAHLILARARLPPPAAADLGDDQTDGRRRQLHGPPAVPRQTAQLVGCDADGDRGHAARPARQPASARRADAEAAARVEAGARRAPRPLPRRAHQEPRARRRARRCRRSRPASSRW